MSNEELYAKKQTKTQLHVKQIYRKAFAVSTIFGSAYEETKRINYYY